MPQEMRPPAYAGLADNDVTTVPDKLADAVGEASHCYHRPANEIELGDAVKKKVSPMTIGIVQPIASKNKSSPSASAS